MRWDLALSIRIREYEDNIEGWPQRLAYDLEKKRECSYLKRIWKHTCQSLEQSIVKVRDTWYVVKLKIMYTMVILYTSPEFKIFFI